MDRLKREGNPPVGQLASPVPQYKRPGSTDYEAVEGQHGAPFAILKDASGNIVSPATDTKLEQVKSELELIKNELEAIKANQTSGDQKVQLSGTKEVIRSFNHSVTEEYHQFGDVVTGRANGVNLDVRNFSEIEIRIRNSATRGGVVVPLRNYQLAVYLEERRNIRLPTDNIGSIYSKVGPEIPAGATLWITREEEPILAQPRCLYVIVRTSCGGTGESYGGNIEVDFIGKR